MDAATRVAVPSVDGAEPKVAAALSIQKELVAGKGLVDSAIELLLGSAESVTVILL